MQYPGGKNASGVYQRIINQIPPHTTYIEPFLGFGAIMRLKKPADCSIGIDADMDIIKKWEDWGAGHIVQHGDAISFLCSYEWQGGEFVYCDPPYLKSTRSTKDKLYRHEFWTEEQHEELLTVLLSLPCTVALSGYKSELYDRMLKGWRVMSYTVYLRRHGKATEYLWMNYPEPLELHDYQYLGDDYRERENIKKQQKRWRRIIADMPRLKRLALMSVISEKLTPP